MATRYESLLAMRNTTEPKNVIEHSVVTNKLEDSSEVTQSFSSLYVSNIDKSRLSNIEGDYVIYYDEEKNHKMAELSIKNYKLHGEIRKYTYDGGLIYVANYVDGVIIDIEIIKDNSSVMASQYDNENTTIIAKNIMLYNAVLNNGYITSMTVKRSDKVSKFIDVVYDGEFVDDIDYYRPGNSRFMHSTKENGVTTELQVNATSTTVINYNMEGGSKTGGTITNLLFNSDIEFAHSGAHVIHVGK